MNPIQDTRAKPMPNNEHQLFLPKLKNNINELIIRRKIGLKSDHQGSSESDEEKKEYSDEDLDPKQFFREILFDLIPDIIMSENDRIVLHYNNKMNPFNKKASLGQRL